MNCQEKYITISLLRDNKQVTLLYVTITREGVKMKRKFYMFLILVICYLQGYTAAYGETRILETGVLHDMERWVYIYKKAHNRLPRSFDDLIDNIPDIPQDNIKNKFILYTEKIGYVISFDFVNENRIKIVLKSGNTEYAFENEGNENFFYINGWLVSEYSRNASGDIINYKEHEEGYENVTNQLMNEVKRRQ